jgi:hypothetical protein
MISCSRTRSKFFVIFLSFVSLLSLSSSVSEAQVSLRHKIGQMIMVTFVGDSLEKSSASLDTMKSDLANGFVGGTIFFTWSNNYTSFERTAAKIRHTASDCNR